MIVGAFHTRQDHWILPHKLRVMSAICDRVLVICDRDIEAEPICRRFPKVEVIHWVPQVVIPDREDGGAIQCEEGRMRQHAWDWCAAHRPDYVILGDSDEIPTPDIVSWLASKPDPRCDCWYFDLVNLYGGAHVHIAGGTIYSYLRTDSNKRGTVCTWHEGREYRYRVDAYKHVRAEPSPVHESRPVCDATHVWVREPKVVHYKWAHWPRWMASPQRHSVKYQGYLRDVETVPTPRPWLWLWDAEELLRALPEPIAVVGNAVMRGRGPEIDACASVIRFNNYRIEGHEADVGTKTDVWCVNCWGDVESRPWTGEIVTMNSAGHYKEETGKWLGTHPHMRIPMQDWIGESAADTGIRRPSTGLTLVHRLHKMGKAFKVFGFGGLARGGHYWQSGFQHGFGHCDELPALQRMTRIELDTDETAETMPPFKIPKPCGGQNPRTNREGTQMGWYELVQAEARGMSVLDVGCGMGDGMELLKRSGKCGPVTGIDIDPALAADDVVIGDIASLPDKSVDVVCCIDCIEHVVEDAAFFRHLKRIARKKVIISTPNYNVSKCFNSCHCREYTPAQFATFFSPHVHLMGSSDGHAREVRTGANDNKPHQAAIINLT